MRSLLVFVCALGAATFAPASWAQSQCKLIRIAEWPVRLERNQPVIEGAINGKKVGILLDTGAYASLLTKDTAQRLDLITRATANKVIGFGGESRVLVTRLDELRIGEAVRANFHVRVAGERPIRGVDFILGDDFFKAVDLEFDYARGVIRLFQPQDCKKTWLAYWDANAFQVPMESGNKIVFPVQLNGRKASAMLDSGAAASVVSLRFAETLGTTPQSPGVSAAGCSSGIGEDVVHAWVAPFDSIAIGNELIRNPRLYVEDYMPELAYTRNEPPEVILGTDFLRAHRVLVSRSQEKVYFSYTGGLVFPASPRLACDDRKAKDAADRLAEYEEALAKDPNDAAARVGRAFARSAKRDYDGALADLDAAIRQRPNDAIALMERARIRSNRKDYDGALADLDEAIASGVRNGHAHANRAMIWRARGNLDRALLEYDEILKLDPTDRESLRTRARLSFLLGRFEEADRDYSALLQVTHKAFDAIWLQMARARRGLDARIELEKELSDIKEEWPAPILRYQLGRLDRDSLMSVAAVTDEKSRRERVCEARYYVAERLLVEGSKAEALKLLESAKAECPRNFIEYDSALVQLARLR